MTEVVTFKLGPLLYLWSVINQHHLITQLHHHFSVVTGLFQAGEQLCQWKTESWQALSSGDIDNDIDLKAWVAHQHHLTIQPTTAQLS